MSRAGRKRKLVPREPDGRTSRVVREASRPIDPTLAYRAKEAASLGMRAPEWGTPAGQWFLAGKLTPTQYETAKRYAGLVATVRRLMGVPVPKAGLSVYGLPSGASTGDPDPTLVLEWRDMLARADDAIRTAAKGGRDVLIRILVDDEHDAPNFPVLTHCLDVLTKLWGTKTGR